MYCTDTRCCYDCDFLVCLLVVSLLLPVFLAMSVLFLTLLGSCVLTWHPAGLAAVTCMREEPISLQGEQSGHLWLFKVSLRHCGHVFANSVRSCGQLPAFGHPTEQGAPSAACLGQSWDNLLHRGGGVGLNI